MTFTRKILLLKAEFVENLILESYYRRIKFLNQIFNHRKVKFEGPNACDLRDFSYEFVVLAFDRRRHWSIHERSALATIVCMYVCMYVCILICILYYIVFLL